MSSSECSPHSVHLHVLHPASPCSQESYSLYQQSTTTSEYYTHVDCGLYMALCGSDIVRYGMTVFHMRACAYLHMTWLWSVFVCHNMADVQVDGFHYMCRLRDDLMFEATLNASENTVSCFIPGGVSLHVVYRVIDWVRPQALGYKRQSCTPLPPETQ